MHGVFHGDNQRESSDEGPTAGDEDIASGTSAFQFLRQLSSGIGVVIGQVLLTSEIQQHTHLFVTSGISVPLIKQLRTGNLVSAIEVLPQLQTPVQIHAVKMAYTESLSIIWIFFACAAAAGVLASLFVGQQVLSKMHQEFKTGLQSQRDGQET